MRYLIIGDIHGCLEELQELVEIFKPNKQDKIICTGDILNRYNDSFPTLNYLYQNNIISVLGNHELKYLECIENFSTLNKIQQEKIEKLNARTYYKWLRTWPFIIETELFIVVHGGFRVLHDIYKNTPQDCVHLREINHKPWYKSYKGEKTIYYGHWAKQGFHVENNTVCLDGGCVYGKNLIGAIVSKEKITYIRVAAKKQYEKIIEK